jgi:hypothetical protein
MSVSCYYSGVCATNQGAILPGYYCQARQCYKCPSGTYSTTGTVCRKCPQGFSSVVGAGRCSVELSLDIPGLQRTYIPSNVTKINVKLWGAGGGGDTSGYVEWPPGSGGGGAFASCNITVKPNSYLSVIVAGGGQTNPLTYYANVGGEYWDGLSENE